MIPVSKRFVYRSSSLVLNDIGRAGFFFNSRYQFTGKHDFLRSIQPFEDIERNKRRSIKAAVILDEFSEAAFEHEWEQVDLEPKGWRSIFEEAEPDLLFVESVWHGHNHSWDAGITSVLYPTLAEIVAFCNKRGIPTVFWNKEDPPSFNYFLQVAGLFDFVFTTDADCVDRYKALLKHSNVSVLPFGAQPSIHNPRRQIKGYASRDVAFSGTYFKHKFPERRDQMDLLLSAGYQASASMSIGLEIFSRFDGVNRNYDFPLPFSHRVVGSLPYSRMLSAYRLYKVFLNVNSVVSSPTMCPRRIFELVASGTAVVSTYSKAIPTFFPSSEVCVVDDQKSAKEAICALVHNTVLREHMIHLGQRRIWREHTYGHRVDTILQTIGLGETRRSRPTVSALVSTNRPTQIDHVLDSVVAMNGVNNIDVQLCLLTHGFRGDSSIVERASQLGLSGTVLIHEPASTPLGSCYNKLAAVANGEVVAKIDDDDLYGPHYLSDQVYALDYSGADVVGKQAHYTWFESSNCTSIVSPEREHKLTHFVAGPTIVTWRKTLLETPFREINRGEDTKFLQDVIDAGGTIYSADRYNFVRVRGSHGHTWALSDWEMLAKSDVVVNGLPKDQIFF
ncbi:glycosyltransferase [Corynebacterium sp. P5848]|uniref:glycosyltransferase family protein n=1 Tax=Corynebacterium marambiense TaxID=2765364 RepID=UPI002260E0EC|nr:glycosyltransferase [Corynebacterium marambiense]MCX7542892.1 glycosyltransferase [Corynebacterium marambiense]